MRDDRRAYSQHRHSEDGLFAGRIGRLLERRGIVERVIENAWLAGDCQPGPLGDLIWHSIIYRIAVSQRHKLERLCRYVSRAPVAIERLALTASGHVRYTLKTPYSDGTAHIVLEPLDLMARLAALVPPPRMHLTRFHGVFAPHSKLRAAVTPAHRGVGAASQPPAGAAKPPTPSHVAMNWARRLKAWHAGRLRP